MRKIPAALNVQFDSLLVKKKIPQRFHTHYLKWLRYYLDFCQKYRFSESPPRSLPNFIRKLKEKKQPDAQQKQANEAIHIYYELIRSKPIENTGEMPKHPTKSEGVSEALNSYRATPLHSKLQINTSKRDSAQNKAFQTVVRGNRQAAYKQLSDEIEVRRYSPKTLKSYSIWVRKFQHFSKSKEIELLSTMDVKDFLTFLAVKRKVSASSQNQAFNAALFFFRHVLKRNSERLTVW